MFTSLGLFLMCKKLGLKLIGLLPLLPQHFGTINHAEVICLRSWGEENQHHKSLPRALVFHAKFLNLILKWSNREASLSLLFTSTFPFTSKPSKTWNSLFCSCINTYVTKMLHSESNWKLYDKLYELQWCWNWYWTWYFIEVYSMCMLIRQPDTP